MKSDRDIMGYWIFNAIVFVLVIWFGYKSILFMGVGDKTWAIVTFALAIGLIVFAVGQIVVYYIYKGHQREIAEQGWARERKKYGSSHQK